MIVIGADVAYRHAAAVILEDGVPVERVIAKVPARHDGESWGDYISRGRREHESALEQLPGGAPMLVEQFPEKIPHNQNQAPAVAAAAWWVSHWSGMGNPSTYVEILEWRHALWPRSLVKAKQREVRQGNRYALKALAIEQCHALGWREILRGLNKDLRGDVAEATLIGWVAPKIKRGWFSAILDAAEFLREFGA